MFLRRTWPFASYSVYSSDVLLTLWGWSASEYASHPTCRRNLITLSFTPKLQISLWCDFLFKISCIRAVYDISLVTWCLLPWELLYDTQGKVCQNKSLLNKHILMYIFDMLSLKIFDLVLFLILSYEFILIFHHILWTSVYM